MTSTESSTAEHSVADVALGLLAMAQWRGNPTVAEMEVLIGPLTEENLIATVSIAAGILAALTHPLAHRPCPTGASDMLVSLRERMRASLLGRTFHEVMPSDWRTPPSSSDDLAVLRHQVDYAAYEAHLKHHNPKKFCPEAICVLNRSVNP